MATSALCYAHAVPPLFDPDVVLWAAAVVDNGGWVSNLRKIQISTFVRTIKDCGIWDLRQDMGLLCAETEVQQLVSLKGRVLGEAVVGQTFVADDGYAPDGESQYIDTKIIPAAYGGRGGIEIYERTNVFAGSTDYAMGVQTPTTGTLWAIRPRSADTTATVNVASGGRAFTIEADSRGLTAATNDGAGTVTLYKKDSLIDTIASTPTPRSMAHTLAIGAFNSGGTIRGFRAGKFAFWGIGDYATTDQMLAYSAALDAHLTVIGAAV